MHDTPSRRERNLEFEEGCWRMNKVINFVWRIRKPWNSWIKSQRLKGVKRNKTLMVEDAKARRCFRVEAGTGLDNRVPSHSEIDMATAIIRSNCGMVDEEILGGGIPMFTATFWTCSSADSGWLFPHSSIARKFFSNSWRAEGSKARFLNHFPNSVLDNFVGWLFLSHGFSFPGITNNDDSWNFGAWGWPAKALVMGKFAFAAGGVPLFWFEGSVGAEEEAGRLSCCWREATWAWSSWIWCWAAGSAWTLGCHDWRTLASSKAKWSVDWDLSKVFRSLKALWVASLSISRPLDLMCFRKSERNTVVAMSNARMR